MRGPHAWALDLDDAPSTACVESPYLGKNLPSCGKVGAAHAAGESGDRPVGDIDLLLLGDPDRDILYERLRSIEERLGRPIQVTIRPSDWLDTGSGSFHDTVVSRPVVAVPI